MFTLIFLLIIGLVVFKLCSVILFNYWCI